MSRHFVALGNDALYSFDSQLNFFLFVEARARSEMDPNIPLATPQQFHGRIEGRVWYMRDASSQEWQELAMIAKLDLPPRQHASHEWVAHVGACASCKNWCDGTSGIEPPCEAGNKLWGKYEAALDLAEDNVQE